MKKETDPIFEFFLRKRRDYAFRDADERETPWLLKIYLRSTMEDNWQKRDVLRCR